MNRNQWFVIAIGLYLIGMLLMNISLQWQVNCGSLGYEVSMTCIRGQIFAPYPYIFFGLGLIFSICGLLEPKKKK